MCKHPLDSTRRHLSVNYLIRAFNYSDGVFVPVHVPCHVTSTTIGQDVCNIGEAQTALDQTGGEKKSNISMENDKFQPSAELERSTLSRTEACVWRGELKRPPFSCSANKKNKK